MSWIQCALARKVALRKRFVPLTAFSAYILATMFWAFWGPITFIGLDRTWVFFYITAFLLLFAIGYTIGTRPRMPLRFRDAEVVERRALVVTKAAIIVTFAYKFVQFLTLQLSGKLDLSLANMGRNYVEMYTGYRRGSGEHTLDFLIGIPFYLPLLIAIILGLYYFSRLSKPYKLLLLGIILLVLVVNTVGQGKQKQLGDIIICLLSVMFIRIGQRANALAPHAKPQLLRVYIGVVLIAAAGFVGFINVLSSRYEALGVDIHNIARAAHPRAHYELDHPVFEVLGGTTGFGVSTFMAYLTQGYLGLSLSAREPFVGMYGVGNSYSMTVVAGRFLKLPVTIEDSYPSRVGASTGWGLRQWHSAFSWLASDFTLPGVLVILAFVAYFWGTSWRESALYSNPASVLLFCLLNLGLVFVPANNQLLHTPESVLAVFCIVTVWFVYHRRLNCRPS